MVKRDQSLAGLIRQRLESYEKRFYDGIRQRVIVEELHKEGYEISLGHFKYLLHSAREKLKEKGAISTQKVIAKTPLEPIKKHAENDTDQPGKIDEVIPVSGSRESLEKIINSTPDLEALAKIAKEKRK